MLRNGRYYGNRFATCAWAVQSGYHNVVIIVIWVRLPGTVKAYNFDCAVARERAGVATVTASGKRVSGVVKFDHPNFNELRNV